jgi:hypothetical protein
VWFSYGIAIRNAAIIVSNGLAFIVGVATVAVALRFRMHEEGAGGRMPDEGLGSLVNAEPSSSLEPPAAD